MKVSFKLAVSYLKSQKGKSLALITSISLAVMLIFTLNVIPETKSEINIKEAYKNFSDYHAEYNNLSDSVSNQLEKDKEVKEIHDVINLGSIVDKNGVSIQLDSYNEDFIKNYGYKLINGTYPKNENEIVLEEKALKEMNLDNKLNEEIDFTVVKHYVDNKNEKQIYSKKKKFKLVGIVQKPEGYYKGYNEGNEYYNVRGFTYFSNNQNIIPKELVTHSGILKFSTKTPSMSKADEIIGKYKLNDGDLIINTQLSNALDDYEMSKSTTFSRNNKLIPMLSAALVIFSIFNIILIDMTKQIGILRAIGMKKKNVRLMILIQSLIVLILGLVLGFALGYVISLIGISSIYGSQQNIYISKESIMEPLELASFAVLISCVFSTYKGSKISPMEAIRDINNNTKKGKDKFYHKLIRKIFGLTGEMAFKNVWRNKSRTILSILSISLAGSLFISKMAIFNNDEENSGSTSMSVMAMGDTDVILRHNFYNTEEAYCNYDSNLINKISKIDNIKEVYPSMNLTAYLKSSINNISDDVKPFISSKDNQNNLEIITGVKGYNKNFIRSLDKYIEEGSNIYEKNKEDYPRALVSNYFYSPMQSSNNAKVLKKVKVGDLIDIKVPSKNKGKLEYKNIKVKVSGLLNKDYVVTQDGGLGYLAQLILNEDDLKNITNIKDYNKISIKLEDGKDEEVNKALDELTKGSSFKEIESKYKYESRFKEESEENKKEVLVSVILTLIISSINIICIIKTNIMLRIKELATLRAMGMSMKNIKKMIVKESMIYALFSIVVSSVVATISYSKFIYMVNSIRAEGLGLENSMSYNIPINEILQFGIATIVMCLLATYLSRNKIIKLSIVEGLRIND
ncbi:ABC transporter permease [Terrisporobacter glycolicus]|uniref:ABC3 transporter permease C-terminal domain-containing protein n=1 Tax=Terrisporobacter glycolicus ATCC 14880 = DSM 1288 TaxID=1121315 RepID=A0ABZ2EYB4_9FIRM|nr:ABC transporter permease [Terrisporobacter glycolicus]